MPRKLIPDTMEGQVESQRTINNVPQTLDILQFWAKSSPDVLIPTEKGDFRADELWAKLITYVVSCEMNGGHNLDRFDGMPNFLKPMINSLVAMRSFELGTDKPTLPCPTTLDELQRYGINFMHNDLVETPEGKVRVLDLIDLVSRCVTRASISKNPLMTDDFVNLPDFLQPIACEALERKAVQIEKLMERFNKRYGFLNN